MRLRERGVAGGQASDALPSTRRLSSYGKRALSFARVTRIWSRAAAGVECLAGVSGTLGKVSSFSPPGRCHSRLRPRQRERDGVAACGVRPLRGESRNLHWRSEFHVCLVARREVVRPTEAPREAIGT